MIITSPRGEKGGGGRRERRNRKGRLYRMGGEIILNSKGIKTRGTIISGQGEERNAGHLY